jgi:predicted transporter
MDYLGDYLTAGALAGIAILSFKTGIGCGLSGLKRREILGFAGVYALVAFLLGGLAGVVSPEITSQVMAFGLLMHLIIAAGLVWFGIQTRRSWLSERKDISKRTFLWVALPCPACVAATFLACLVLADVTGTSGFGIGAFVGLVFMAGILLTSLLVSFSTQKFGKKNPSTLGSTMIALGLFYLLCPLIIPAYIDAQKINQIDFAVPAGDVGLGVVLFCLPVAAGFLTDSLRRRRENGGQ